VLWLWKEPLSPVGVRGWVGFRVIMAIMIRRIFPYYKKLNPNYPDCRQSLYSGGIAQK
jgi:hypothetical protein